MRIEFLLFGLMLWVPASAQTAPRKQPESLIERACAGESAAATEVEETADSQDLQRMMHDPDCSIKRSARLVLAKRGDHEALQFFACKSLTDRFDLIQELLREDFSRLGGEFTIEVYRQLLDSDQRFQADFKRVQKECSDCIVLPLSDSVPTLLKKLLPDGPASSLSAQQLELSKEPRESLKSMWRSWIDTHQAELKQMQPTASGISFDAASCSQVADSSALERRLNATAGVGAIACGSDTYGTEARAAANRCIKKAFAHAKPFYASFVLGGNVLWNPRAGVAGDGVGNVFVLLFDDSGASHSELGDNVEIFDNGDTVVAPCPKPIKFQESYSGNLTCIRRRGNLELGPSSIH
jgi:hypothetical protein